MCLLLINMFYDLYSCIYISKFYIFDIISKHLYKQDIRKRRYRINIKYTIFIVDERNVYEIK